MSYDITFCPDESCNRTDCHRHRSHTPVGVPYSMFVESPAKDLWGCGMYWPGAVAEKPKKKRKEKRMYHRIYDTDEVVVDYYNDGKPMLRISLFEDGHWKDEHFVEVPEGKVYEEE